MSASYLAVQFEFTHAIGPHAGRYVVVNPAVATDADGAVPRAEAGTLTRRERLTGVTMSTNVADVLAITVEGAPSAKPQRIRRRAREHDEQDEVPPVPLLLATFIRGTRPLDKKEADAQLLDIAADEDRQQQWVQDALAVLNRAIRAYRHGARDPYVTEVAPRDARAVRIGYGTTEGLPHGRFTRAAVLPPPLRGKPSKAEKLVPAETTADALAGRIVLLEGEDVLLRAFADLDHGRTRAALLQVRAAMHLLELELQEVADGGGVRLDFDAMAGRADELLASDATAAQVTDEVEAMVAEIERELSVWRYDRTLA